MSGNGQHLFMPVKFGQIIKRRNVAVVCLFVEFAHLGAT